MPVAAAHRRLGIALALALAAGAVALALTTAAGGGSPAPPACFGAASRDALRPCRSRAAAALVLPAPQEARRRGNSPCTVVRSRVPYVCAFGAPAAAAGRTVALLGDSHAAHWRAALAPVAQRRRWHGVSLTRAACPFSLAVPVLPARLLPACLAWRRAVLAWFGAHPEIDTVFVSAHRPRVRLRRRESRLATEIRGYLRAWRALPRTVRRIVVIRDTPADPPGTGACLRAAIAARAPAGERCASDRARALRVDPEALAVRRARSPRVRLVDLTRFMCDRARCYPVVGGALVHKDGLHLTATFAATLAPYLGRALDRVLGAPGAPIR